MAYNARQLGEVADGAHRSLNFRVRSGARRQFGFHSYRYFAKLLVMCSTDGFLNFFRSEFINTNCNA